jgi:hypothetical protein
MARIVYQDKTLTLPDIDMDGRTLVETLAVPTDHDLVLVRPEGNQLIKRSQKLHLQDGDQFVDAPTFEYGAPV